MESKTKKVMLIDDDVTIRLLIRTVAKLHGASVIENENGKQALTYLVETQSQEGMPDLILVDVYMPYMDGIVFCNKLKEEFGYPLERVIIVSAASKKDDLVKINALGTGGFLHKPFTIDQLRKLFSSFL